MDSSQAAMIGGAIIAACAVNFIPTFIAYATRHPERKLLASINVLSILSFILWFALLAWAIGGKRNDSVIGRLAGDARTRRIMAGVIAVLFVGGAATTAYALAT